MKHLFLLTFTVSAIFADTNQIENACTSYDIKILYQRKGYLVSLLDSCTFGIGKYTKNCDKVFTCIDSMKNRPLKEWEKKEERLWKEFFHFCRIDPRIRIQNIF